MNFRRTPQKKNSGKWEPEFMDLDNFLSKAHKQNNFYRLIDCASELLNVWKP